MGGIIFVGTFLYILLWFIGGLSLVAIYGLDRRFPYEDVGNYNLKTIIKVKHIPLIPFIMVYLLPVPLILLYRSFTIKISIKGEMVSLSSKIKEILNKPLFKNETD